LATCPSDFSLVRNGECYMQANKNYNAYVPSGPSTVINTCHPLGGAMPIMIKNKEDHDYWLSVALRDNEQQKVPGNVFIGIECNDSHQWQWMDGSEITFKPDNHPSALDNRCDTTNCLWAMDPVTQNWKVWCGGTYQFIDIYCIISPDSSLQPDQDCTDFSHDGDDDVCYQVGYTMANWTEANTICRSFGANVASIHNQQENNFIRRLAVSKGLVDGLMLGGAPTGKQNTFGWIDGSEFDYQNFVPGFPMEGFGDCLAMETNNVNGPWLNIDCTTELPFACSRKTTDQEPICDGAMRKEGDIIYSPGFPFNSSLPCDFLLKVDTGMLVEVEILMLEANSCCDKLVLTEGTLGGAVLADLTGEISTGKTFRTKTQNIMRASWQPNGGVNVKGMMIQFRGVPK
ncbi:hypothetical protein PENTCL1PPCAC_21319, partial [Pristionchus entomophagus]